MLTRADFLQVPSSVRPSHVREYCVYDAWEEAGGWRMTFPAHNWSQELWDRVAKERHTAVLGVPDR